MLNIEDIFDKQGFFKVEPIHVHYTTSRGETVDYFSLYEPFHGGASQEAIDIKNTLYYSYDDELNKGVSEGNVNIEFHQKVADYIMTHWEEIHPLSDIVKYYYSAELDSVTQTNYPDIYMWRYSDKHFSTLEEITLNKKCN